MVSSENPTFGQRDKNLSGKKRKWHSERLTSEIRKEWKKATGVSKDSRVKGRVGEEEIRIQNVTWKIVDVPNNGPLKLIRTEADTLGGKEWVSTEVFRAGSNRYPICYSKTVRVLGGFNVFSVTPFENREGSVTGGEKLLIDFRKSSGRKTSFEMSPHKL